MQNSVAKKIFAVGSAVAMSLALGAPLAALAAVHADGTNVSDSTGTVYMIVGGQRRPYTSAGAFLSYGFNSFASVAQASAEDLALPVGSFIPPQDGSIICSDRGSDKGTCYEISNGMKYGFTSAAVFTGLGFSFANSVSGDVSWMTAGSSLISNTTNAHLPGTLVNNGGTVQLVGANGLLGVPDLSTFNSWGYSFSKVVPANAADKTMTQTGVFSARTAGMLSPSWTTTPSNPGQPVISGNVTASLSSDTPAAASIVAGQAIADLAHFTFSGSGTVTQVVVKRTGVSADATLSNVYLYNGNTKLTDAGSVSNSTVTFSNPNGLFTVNGSMNIAVKSDIASLTSGQTVGAQLASFAVANGTPVSTSLSGNLMTIATATLAGVTVSVPTGPGSSINAGTINASLWSSTLTVSTRAVSLKYVNFKQVGSVQPSAIQNLKLYVNGNQVGGTASIDSNNNVSFDLSGSPVTLNTGAQTLELRGDVVAGSSFTFSFRLQTVSDIVLVDSNYNVNISASGTFPAVPSTTTTVSQGTITVQTDPSFNATQVVKNSSNVTLGQWTFKAYGEAVKVQSLQVGLVYTGSATSTEGFNNLSIYVNGVQQGSSQNMIVSGAGVTGATSTAFGSTNLFTVPAGQTVTVAVKGDMVNLTSGSTWTAVNSNLIVAANTLQGLTSYNTSPASTTYYAASSALSIVSSTVTTAKNSGYANQTIPSNMTNQKIGSFTIQASNAESVRVSSLTIAFPAGTGNSINPTTTLANLYIVTPAGNSTQQPPSASNNFPVSFTLAASQTATIDVFADITNTTGNVTTSLSGQGTGVSSGQTVYINADGTSSGAAVTGQLITVGNGTLSSPYATLQSVSPVSQLVLSGSTNQPAGTFNFVSSNGGVTITELGFLIATSSGATTVPVTAVAVNGGSAQPVVGSTSTITGLNIAVPSGYSGVNVPVTVNYGVVSPLAGMVSNQTATTTLSYIKYTSGGQTTTLYPSVASNGMTVVAGRPSIGLAAAGGSLTIGTVKIGSVTVSADAAGGDIILNQLPIQVSTSGTITVASGSAVIVKDASNNSTLNTTDTTFTGSLADTITFNGGGYRISAGTTKTFDIYATVGGSLGSAGTSRVTLGAGSSSNFLWTDVNGNKSGITGANIYNYPNTTVSLSN